MSMRMAASWPQPRQVRSGPRGARTTRLDDVLIRVYPLTMSEWTDFGFDGADELAARKQFAGRGDVDAQIAIIIEMRHAGPDRAVRDRRAAPERERRAEIERLRRLEQFDREDVLEILDYTRALTRGYSAHADVVFLARRRGNRIHGCGRAERLVLADERRRGILRNHEAAAQSASLGEEHRQAFETIEQFVDAPFGDRSKFGKGDREVIHRHRDRLAVEVPDADKGTVLWEDHGVIGHRVDLEFDRVLDESHAVAHRAVHDRHAAKRIRILHAIAVAVRGHDARIAQQAPQIRADAQLPGVRPERVHAFDERCVAAEESLEAHRTRDVGGFARVLRVEKRERADRGHHLRAVDQRYPFLIRQAERCEPGGRKRAGAGQQLTVVPRLALAHEDERDVRERCQIAGGTDRPLTWHDRQHVAVQHGEKKIDRLLPDAGIAAGERMRT